ncbi:MarR family transcriptional regulator [Arthrobacter bussei]|uniref:MarR family transcriptional regulator n=1 Tax=Arthrobacter bussei TaxID=2594179 RepID=A0A7X1TN36_9MICC|nr:MarR family transcriptional regulator [Arthrobacter bussei]
MTRPATTRAMGASASRGPSEAGVPSADKEWSASRLLTTAARLWEQEVNERLQGVGLTTAGLVALQALEAVEPVTQAALARILHLQPQTLRRTLASLEDRAFLTRGASAVNGRALTVRLTDAGRETLRRAGETLPVAPERFGSEPGLRTTLVVLLEGLGVQHAPDAV